MYPCSGMGDPTTSQHIIYMYLCLFVFYDIVFVFIYVCVSSRI